MKIVCDSCGTKYSISDDKVRGKVFKIRCKKCSHIIVVRGTNDAAAAPAATAEGGWHLVVDGEQVGPLPETDIRGKLERNEINADTYVWKEGFADWIKLSTVPEFADVLGRGGSGPEVVAEASAPVATNGTEGSGATSGSGRQRSGPSGLFGGVAAAVTAGNDSDVFAAPAPAAAARGSGGDLFASSAARPAAEEPRWPATGAPAANHGGGGAGGAGGHDGGRVESLTGQRHENSVLFSLSNLQSLAMPSASTKPLSSTAPTSEGSGLIDIRAMAATTLGAPGGSGSSFGGGGGGDDLPAFGAFSSAAPVLLPLPSSSGPSKVIYAAIAAVVVLALGVIGLAYKLLSDKPTQVITQQAPAAAAPAAAPAGAPSAPVAAAVPSSKPTTIPDENLPPREAPRADGKPEAKAEGKGERHHGGGGAHKGDKGDKDKKGGDEKKVTVAAAAAPEPAEKKPAKGSLDDLLEGALSPKRGGGAARARGGDDDAPSRRAEPAAAGPLAKGAIVAGMNGVRPKVNECYSQYKVQGTAMVTVVIGKNGKVSSAAVTGKFAGTPTGACVEKAVKTASFPPSDGLTTPYPFLLK